MDEAERLKESIEDEGVLEVVGPVSGIGLVGIPATSADSIEIDPGDFDQAIRLLHQRRDELAGHLTDSAVLATPLPDGEGPVAGSSNSPNRDTSGYRPTPAGRGN